MNGIPWFSTLTLVTELVITISILFIFYNAYKYNKFYYGFTAAVLAYEALINVGYMTRSLFDHTVGKKITSPYYIVLAAFHGSFSLLMFILLLVFMFFAWRNYKKGINFFLVHKKLTITFLISWMVAVITGFLFYYLLYFH